MNTRFFSLTTLLCCALLTTSCTKSGGSDDGDTSSAIEDIGTSSDGRSVVTDCGVVHQGDLQNPVSLDNGELVSVEEVFAGNLLSIRTVSLDGIQPEGLQLVKLQGVSSDGGFGGEAARTFVNRLTSGQARFFKASPECAFTTADGGQGVIGTIITDDGLSVAEEVVKKGYAAADPNDACSGALIGSCLNALERTEIVSAGTISAALWKPVSDSTGNLAVHTEPFGASVLVNGEKGVDAGSGNGYGSLARFGRPGCAYGANIRVSVVNESGMPFLNAKGEDTFIIPNGCERYCLNAEGNVVLCPKS